MCFAQGTWTHYITFGFAFRKCCQSTLCDLQMCSGFVFVGQSNLFNSEIPPYLRWTSKRSSQIFCLCNTLGPYNVHIVLLLGHHFSPDTTHSSIKNEYWAYTLWRKSLEPQTFNVLDCCIISMGFRRYICILCSLV